MHPSPSEPPPPKVESPEEREARHASYTRAAFVAIEKSRGLVGESQSLIVASARRAEQRSDRVERRLLAESKAWFVARPAQQ